jgi:T5SS/PEP-CTERM-associated repeat protein
MVRKISLTLLLILTLTVSTQAQTTLLAGWDTAGINANTATLAPTTTHPSLTISSITKGSGLNNINSYPANTFSSQGWTTNANTPDVSDYFQITLSANSGNRLTLSHILFNFRKSGTGPNKLRWRYSTNGNTFHDVGGTYTPSTGDGVSLGPVDLTGIPSIQGETTLTLRLYGWDASGTSGVGGIGRLTGNDLEIFGTVTVAAPNTPTLTLNRDSNIANKANLSWTIPSNTTSFTLARSQNNGPFQTIASNIANTTDHYEDILTTNGNYKYALHAISEGQTSPTATLTTRTLTMETPDEINGNYTFTSSFTQNWGMDPAQAAIYSSVVLFQDGSPGNTACTDATNASELAGKIAFLYRGDCEFGSKALHAQNAGAIAVIIVNSDDSTFTMSAGSQGNGVTIPVLLITNTDGSTLRPFVDNGQLQASIGDFLVNTIPPNAPTLTATKSAPTSKDIAISWNTPNTTDTFRLERAFNNGNYSVIDDTLVSANVSLNETGLADGTYIYRIIAIDSFGNESTAGFSDTLTIDTTAPNAPTEFIAITSGNTIILSWTNPLAPDFESIQVLKLGELGHSHMVILDNSQSTSVTVNGLAFNTTHHFQVLARDAFGNVSVAATTNAYLQIRAEDLAKNPNIDSGELEITQNVTTPIIAPKIGTSGTATLNLSSGYQSVDTEIGVNNGAKGTLVLTDNSSVWKDSGDVVIGKNGEGEVQQHSGSVEVTGKIILGQQAGSKGTYSFAGGSLKAGALELNNGGESSFDWVGGTLEIPTVIGDLINKGGTLAISPETPMTIAGNYIQTAASTMTIGLSNTATEIANTRTQQTRLSGGNNALLTVTGTIDAGNGTLSMTMGHLQLTPGTIINVFSPAPIGKFSQINLPELDSHLQWDQSKLYTAGTLSIVAVSQDLLSSRPLNAPNPFQLSRGSMLGYYLTRAADIELRIYRSSGNEVFRKNFIAGVQEGALVGYNRIMIDNSLVGTQWSAGIYLYVLISDGKVVGKGKFAVNPE